MVLDSARDFSLSSWSAPRKCDTMGMMGTSPIKAKHVSPSEAYMLITSLVPNQTILGGNQVDHGPSALWHKKIHAIDPHLSFSSCWHNFSNSSAARQSPKIYRSPVSIFIWDVVVPTSKSSNFAAWDGLIHHLWNSDLLKSHEVAISSLERSLKSTTSSGRRCSSWAEVRVVPKNSRIKCMEKASVQNENLWIKWDLEVPRPNLQLQCAHRER